MQLFFKKYSIKKTVRNFSMPKSTTGFTLIEILVVIAIMGVFAAVSPRVLSSYSKYNLDSTYNEFVQSLRTALVNSMSGNGNSGWGVHLVTGNGGSFTLFKGSVYSVDDITNEVHTLSSNLAINASSTDIIFSKIDGVTTATGTITITWPEGNLSKGVTINSLGTLTKI